MLGKTFVCTALLCLTSTAFANVIELDNENPDHCRQQLANSIDQTPVVFFYMKDCPYADKLRPIYEKVSNEYPDRTFYAFNFQDMKGAAHPYTWEAQTCLGRMPLVSPTIDVMLVDNEDPKYPTIWGQFKSSLANDEQGIIRAINLDDLTRHASLMKMKKSAH